MTKGEFMHYKKIKGLRFVHVANAYLSQYLIKNEE